MAVQNGDKNHKLLLKSGLQTSQASAAPARFAETTADSFSFTYMSSFAVANARISISKRIDLVSDPSLLLTLPLRTLL